MKEGGRALREGAGVRLARKYCVETGNVVGRDVGSAEGAAICVGRAVGAADLDGATKGDEDGSGAHKGASAGHGNIVGSQHSGQIGSAFEQVILAGQQVKVVLRSVGIQIPYAIIWFNAQSTFAIASQHFSGEGE